MQKTVRTNYVLIDYENVQPQPTDLAMLADGPFKVKVFLGPQQTKIPVALAVVLQGLAPNVEYVPVELAGSNAVDFHIVYSIGGLSTQDASAFFHVISNDKGFDPLLKHLEDDDVKVHRSTSIASIPYFKLATPNALQIEAAVAHLRKLKENKPRTVKKLLNTLNSRFNNELSEQQLSALLSALRKRGIAKVEGTKVTYASPAGPE